MVRGRKEKREGGIAGGCGDLSLIYKINAILLASLASEGGKADC